MAECAALFRPTIYHSFLSFRGPLAHGMTRRAAPQMIRKAFEQAAHAAALRKRNWPNPKVRPSLNREASRLGDVRIRRPSFRPKVPETYSGLSGPRHSWQLSM